MTAELIEAMETIAEASGAVSLEEQAFLEAIQDKETRERIISILTGP